MSAKYVRKSSKSANHQYRRRVPLDVQQAVGKRWVERSLNTGDAREADKRAAIITAELDQQWDTLRGTATPLQRWRQGSSWLAQQKPLEFGADDVDEQTGAPIYNDPSNPDLWVGDEMDRLQEGKTKLPEGATDEAYAAWLRGKRTLTAPELTIGDALDLWLKERKPVKSVQDGATRVAAQFEALTGDTPLHSITRLQARQYRDNLVVSGTAPGTIETYLSYLRTIFENAIREQLMPDRTNPFSALKVDKHKAVEEERPPIPRDKCMAILKETLARGFDQADWFAAAMLTTGARPGGLFKSKLVLDDAVPYWMIPREKKSPPRVVPLHPLLIEALKGREPPKYTVQAQRLRNSFIERYKPYVAYQCRHSFNDEARRVGMPMELRLRIMGHSARKAIGENARYGSIEAVLSDAPQWVEKMWR